MQVDILNREETLRLLKRINALSFTIESVPPRLYAAVLCDYMIGKALLSSVNLRHSSIVLVGTVLDKVTTYIEPDVPASTLPSMVMKKAEDIQLFLKKYGAGKPDADAIADEMIHSY